MESKPSGTVTFLFTDIEGSTRRWETSSNEMQVAHSRQEAILRQAIASNGGYVYKMIGDAFQAAFNTAPQAVQAALDAQRALHAQEWGGGGELRVRMGLHTGVTEERDGDYVGPLLNRVARLMSAGHGGQVLLSLTTAQLVQDQLPKNATLRDMGEHRLKDLIRPEHIFQLVVDGLPSNLPPLKTLDNRPNNLPLQLTPLIGREKEVAEAKDMLLRDDIHLLTLTGPGGIGKTRLALQVAAEVLEEFSDGCFFANLTPLTDTGFVIPTIAQTLGIRESGGQTLVNTLAEYLRDKRLLLVLDNFEHLVDAANQVGDLLKSAPQLKVLVTSRAILHLSMEYEYVVPALSVPDLKHLPGFDMLSQYEAVALFIARAQAVKPTFELNNQNASAVAEICVRLEGLPLAIELAAARVKVLTPQALLPKLESRLTVLTGGARDSPTRQQTLRNTIEWSHDLLNEEEKQLFRRMAVFRGGRTLEAATAVCKEDGTSDVDLLDVLESLVDKSLMSQTEGAGGEPRFWMLETIYEYALEKLKESAGAYEVHKRHTVYFLDFAEKAALELRGENQDFWLARLIEENENLREALNWTLSQSDADAARIEMGLKLAGALSRFWLMSGLFDEGRRWMETALAADKNQREANADPETSNAIRAKILHGAGSLSIVQGDYTSASNFHTEGLKLYKQLDDKVGIAFSLNNMGVMAQDLGDYKAARALHEESLSIKRELGDKWGVAYSLGNLGLVAQEQGDYVAAHAFNEECLKLLRELGDKGGVANALNNMGNTAREQGDYTPARTYYEEGLALERELGDKRGIAYSLVNLGLVAREQGDYTSAGPLYREGLIMSQELGDKRNIAYCIEALASVFGKSDHLQKAARLLGAAEALREAINSPVPPTDLVFYQRYVAEARSQLGETIWDAAWLEGRILTPERAVAYALEES